MPELPEVRTVAKVLKKNLLHQKVTNIKIIYPKIIEQTSLDLSNLIGHELKDITTKGKYLIFDFDNLYLISHLRMEGKYFIKNINDEIVKHEHIIIEFGNISLRYHDTRKFGRMYLTENPDYAEEIYKNDNIKLLRKYLNVLTKREREVLTKRYGLDNTDEITQKEIAKELGISRSYVSRIEKRAITKILREFIRNDNSTKENS